MDIVILHSPFSAASRALLDSMGTSIPEGDNVVVVVDSDNVRIVSDHAACVALCPAFPGYPVALIGDGEERRMLAFPASWDAVTAWAANPTAVEIAVTTQMSRTAFLARFSQTELEVTRELAKTDTKVDVFWMLVLAADVIDLTYQPVVDGVRYLVDKLPGFDQARADAILTA